jgi:circadian clock protein KaiA
MLNNQSSPVSIFNQVIDSRNNQLQAKLKERLGDLDVYFQRNPQVFFGNLSRAKKQQFINKLKQQYLQIISNYFSNEQQAICEIDEFVNEVFFANFPLYKIVEIHMELMEELAHQLKIEGLHEEVLLDYRLTLIDVIVHVGEMYRCSVAGNNNITSRSSV